MMVINTVDLILNSTIQIWPIDNKVIKQPYPPAYQQAPFPQQQQPGQQVPFPTSTPTASGPQVPGMLPVEQSYIENILRLNKGKLVSVYSTFENNKEWNAKIFKGVIEAAGRDHLILSQMETGKRVLTSNGIR